MGYLGQDIPKLGFGLMRLPKLEDSETIDIEQTKQMVDAFLQAGGTYFDTARAYGGSEDAVRQALVERYPRESFQLATKNAAWIGPKSYEDARKDFDISLEKTGAGYFDFYLIHNTGSFRTKVFDDLEMWDFVQELKAAGKVKHIGFSHHDSAERLEEIILAHPEMEFVQLQVNWADWDNANTQSRKCVETARKHELPVVVMEPVRGGTLANPPEPVAEILRDANPDATFVEWALRFVWGLEGLITALSGMSSLEQMQQNLATWKGYEPLSHDELATLKRARQKLDEMLDNPCTSCQYCMKACPKDIKIAQVMEALNRGAMYGQDNGKNWYGFNTSGGGKASECIQCFSCEAACPQHIEIVGKLERAADLFE
ncbi:MAG TPA: Fe-S oxidoreductase [Eggerthellaceae bacterium]|nr:Fe-S oxidoreductase [Eggerthellaceae bacterium]